MVLKFIYELVIVILINTMVIQLNSEVEKLNWLLLNMKKLANHENTG
jgi:hypothetical protein